jgi:hypothetical protein
MRIAEGKASLLRSLVATEADLDACAFCTTTQDAAGEEDDICGKLCGAPDKLCDVCGWFSCAAYVDDHGGVAVKPPYWHCEACFQRRCADCLNAAVVGLPVPEKCCFCCTFRCLDCANAGEGAAFIACGLACGAVACSRCVRRGRFNQCDGVALAAGLPRGSRKSMRRYQRECSGHFCPSCCDDGESCVQCSRCDRCVCRTCVSNYPGCMVAIGGRPPCKVLCHTCHHKSADKAAMRDAVPPHHR